MFGTYVQRIPVKGQQRYFVSQGKYRIRDLRESFKLRESFARLALHGNTHHASGTLGRVPRKSFQGSRKKKHLLCTGLRDRDA